MNASNDRGWTALMFAARNGHGDVVELLLRHGYERLHAHIQAAVGIIHHSHVSLLK